MVMELKNVHLAGQSMGSFIAAQFGRQYPHLVQSLSLLCPPGQLHYYSIASNGVLLLQLK